MTAHATQRPTAPPDGLADEAARLRDRLTELGEQRLERRLLLAGFREHAGDHDLHVVVEVRRALLAPEEAGAPGGGLFRMVASAFKQQPAQEPQPGAKGSSNKVTPWSRAVSSTRSACSAETGAP